MTETELKELWGDARYHKAIIALSHWYIFHGVPQTPGQKKALESANADAYELFQARRK